MYARKNSPVGLRCFSIGLFFLFPLFLSAEEAKPSVEKLSPTLFKLKEITFDSGTREIRFPAQVNQIKDLLEYLIVHKNGKIHESLLKTEISPTDLNLAFTLLRFLPGSPLQIHVEWQDGENLRKVPINEWIQHISTGNAMPHGPWKYAAPEITEGRFPPEFTGDIATIIVAEGALIHYPGKDNDNDTVWFVFPKRTPPLDSKVTVILFPFAP